ncbi:hypothetical protein ACIGAN_26125 [Streptomyces sp. NPDC085931]|uniref:hypothetical protein n=1 Tax=Streptomyces sp. NPDC085931 TaxID=3365740 RepID=UPI0037CEA911
MLLPYTDPNGEHRWAVFDYGPTEYDCQDTDDLDEAIAAYEEWVRGATAMPSYDEDGEELPLWDESDVEGVPAQRAKQVYDGAAGNNNARLIDAEWAHEEFIKAEENYQQATRRRQVAFAKMIDSRGRGEQALLACRIDLKEPTVKTIADKGRALLAQAGTADVKDGECLCAPPSSRRCDGRRCGTFGSRLRLFGPRPARKSRLDWTLSLPSWRPGTCFGFSRIWLPLRCTRGSNWLLRAGRPPTGRPRAGCCTGRTASATWTPRACRSPLRRARGARITESCWSGC